jgi:hypothetical protein
MSTPIQDLCENIGIFTLNTGLLMGYVFAHDSSDAKAKPEAVTVQAGGPVPQLDGPQCLRVPLSVTIRAIQAARCAAIHAECLDRLTNPTILRAASIRAGMNPATDDFVVLTEEMDGDRLDSKMLRKRTIVVPFLIRKN